MSGPDPRDAEIATLRQRLDSLASDEFIRRIRFAVITLPSPWTASDVAEAVRTLLIEETGR